MSTTVLYVGYHAEGTSGRQLLEDAHETKFYEKLPCKNHNKTY